MNAVRLRWAPYPHRAGFCITDDTDAATLESVRAVYDLLASVGLKATKTVWAFRPEEPCGIPALPDSTLRGITLEDPDYHAYCESLVARGFEICLHGASAGNNRRERTRRALEVMASHFGRPRTFICHAKNADNPYWHEKTAPPGIAQAALKLASRYRCSGEDPQSPYFWGDLCGEHVGHIRLFRTRNVNTLADNPSMPYHEVEKPFVRSWFSATKRSFADCTSPEAIRQLREERGLCVLYQYMHRYANRDGRGADAAFRAGAERLMAAGDIWVETTTRIMERLNAVHALVVAHRGARLWLCNAGQEVRGVQLEAPAGVTLSANGSTFESGVLHVPVLEAGAVRAVTASAAVSAEGRRCLALDAQGRGEARFEFGSVTVNAGTSRWDRREGALEPGSLAVHHDPRFARVGSWSGATEMERYRLLSLQLGIIGREVLFKGRSLDSRKFLGDQQIALEDHSNW